MIVRFFAEMDADEFDVWPRLVVMRTDRQTYGFSGVIISLSLWGLFLGLGIAKNS